ncbi:hypothetical protein BR93DRAFT_609436 [Coniochaeta sp. PMI_546]|nr:hypothetical protein BR93DRAFT_609436 [Coniochaeta sp. PMI_546]
MLTLIPGVNTSKRGDLCNNLLLVMVIVNLPHRYLGPLRLMEVMTTSLQPPELIALHISNNMYGETYAVHLNQTIEPQVCQQRKTIIYKRDQTTSRCLCYYCLVERSGQMSYLRTNLSQAPTWLTHSLIMFWDRSAFGSAALQPINQDHGAVAEDSDIIHTESPQRRVPLDLVATVTPSPQGRRPFEGPSRSLSNHPVETGCATFSLPKKITSSFGLLRHNWMLRMFSGG